jgi:hypothetical protein
LIHRVLRSKSKKIKPKGNEARELDQSLDQWQKSADTEMKNKKGEVLRTDLNQQTPKKSG